MKGKAVGTKLNTLALFLEGVRATEVVRYAACHPECYPCIPRLVCGRLVVGLDGDAGRESREHDDIVRVAAFAYWGHARVLGAIPVAGGQHLTGSESVVAVTVWRRKPVNDDGCTSHYR